MNQAGRRIASVIASGLLCVSVAGACVSAAFALESEDEGNSPITETSSLTTERPGTVPSTAESGSGTDPETSPPEEGTTTFENDPTGPTGTTSDEPTIETTSPETTVGTGTEPSTDSTSTDEPPVTTTGLPETTESSNATKAPSRDPVLAQGAAVSEGRIPLSTEKDGSPAGTGGSAAGRDPDDPAQEKHETGSRENPAGNSPGEEDVSDSSGQKNGIPRITAICSVFAILSGAVLVLLKFIR